MTTSFNVSNLLSSFNAYNNSFNAAIRYIYDMAKEAVAKIPAAPEKKDKTEEAKALRKSIKEAELKNKLIEDCKAIVEAFAITANDIKGKGIPSLRAKIMANVPYHTPENVAVKFVKLPAYLKNEVKEYPALFAVAPANWIETICAAASNTDTKVNKYYELTTPPIIEEGEVIEGASGCLVDANGNIAEAETIAKVFDIWNKEALINNISNAAGREKAKETKAELKSAK